MLHTFAELPWACSLRDIDWRGKEGLDSASLHHLLQLHGWTSSGSVEDDCRLLGKLLSMPLPVSPWNGYVQLIDAADNVDHHLWLPDPGPEYHWALAIRDYRLDAASRSWWKHCAGQESVEPELDKLRGCLAGSGVHRVQCIRTDARRRFSAREAEASEVELRC